MCRCCQSCLEDLYWNCIEERFCYDETIANYNPDEDEYIIKNSNRLSIVNHQIDNNNVPICHQPLSRTITPILSSKIHEEDYRREIQTSVPILAPEIMTVFQNSQIFAEHQPKLLRTLTNSSTSKSFLAGIHGKEKESDQDKLLKRLEENDETDSGTTTKKITFTIAPDSSPELKRSTSPQHFAAIIEEDTDEVVLRPPRHIEQLYPSVIENKRLRHVQSVPQFSSRPVSENDIFSISGSMSRISMTPELPSISFSQLPKNYEDTPTVEKYKESISLYSIQTANMAKITQEDYSMPRYFRKSGIIAQSTETLSMPFGNQNQHPPTKRDEIILKKPEKSKRLKNLRDSLPPLRIHSVKLRTRNMDT